MSDETGGEIGSGDARPLPLTGEEQLAVLLEQSHRLMAERDPRVLLRDAASAARDITQARGAVAGIRGDDGRFDELVSVGLDAGVIERLKRQSETDGDHPVRRVLARRAVVAGRTLSGDSHVSLQSGSHPPAQSCVFVPVASPDRVYGWLAVIEKIGAPAFSEVDALLARAIGVQAGIVYENVQLMRRLQAQAEELRKQEDETDFAMTAAHIGVFSRDLGSTDVVVSKSLARLLGLPDEVRHVPQEKLYEWTHPDDRERVRATIDKAVHELSDFTFSFRMNLPDGVMRWFQVDGRVALDDARQPARVVGVLADITDRRSLEMQFRQAQKMEAVGQLAGGVAHDFNNLLTAIIGYARFALERAGEGEQRRDIEEITRAASRAAALTKQLLSFSQRHVTETVSIDLNLLIVDMVTMLRRMLGADIELTTSLGPDLPVVRADRSQLEQVLLNLVLNARDATAGGGAILVETRAVTVDAQSHHPELKPGPYVTLTVSDDGCGMSDEIKSRLFEPFFTTKPRGQATGLGLATVYGIVTRSGGAIHVESEPGKGSQFTVYLPAEQRAAHPVEQSGESQRATRTATVLLVEDESAVRDLVRIILEREGYSVVESTNADEAEARFSTMSSLDLLLTDVVMPGRSGFELFKRLQAKLPSLRVLFISGCTDYAAFDTATVGRDLAFLEKPFSSEGLIAKVREVLGH